MPASHRDLLAELLATYGPCGQEDAVRDICRRELSALVDEVWVDAAGNLVGVLRAAAATGTSAAAADDASHAPGAPVIRVTAHMDELSMLVKRVEDSGNLHITPLGVMYPGNFGLGPVAILGDHETITGVLTLGSEHTTQESPRIWQTKPDQGDQALDWMHVYVFTGRTPEQLVEAGVHAGTRVCVDRSKRSLVQFGDYYGCYFLDDRAAIVTALQALRQLRVQGRSPANDVYLVLSTSEELGGIGATYASHQLPGDVTLAIDVGPAEAEYGTHATAGPIIAYGDDAVVYDKAIADRLMTLGRELGVDPQPAVLGSYDSDASQAMSKGVTPRAALLALPTLSTHGYEVMHSGTIINAARLLAEYLCRPVD